MKEKLNEIKKQCLVFDIETSAKYPDGELIDIADNFEDYVKFAKVKWLGMYSYKFDEYNAVNVMEADPNTIREYIGQHKFLIGFNNEEFDTPIMYNNDLMPEDKYFIQVDCMTILGASSFYMRSGKSFKNRGSLMGYKFRSNSLKVMAETMGLETQKEDIDYNVFLKTKWTEEETADIIKYLEADVKVTKQMFDKMWDYWLPFTEFIDDKNVNNLAWIRSSIASLTYVAACKTLGVEPTYGEKSHSSSKEKMGGRVIEPKYEEARNVWYVDFTSLYPHIYCMFNLFNEININIDKNLSSEEILNKYNNGNNDEIIWHGNDLFKVKGYYDISERHPLSVDVANKLRTRVDLKAKDPTNPLVYTLKIFLNSLYGAQRSEVFEKIHTPNGGWDCCWLGQQIQEYTEKRMLDFGFETIAGDTDSIFVIKSQGEATKAEVIGYLKTIVDEIKANVPFPVDTYNIDIEEFIEYVMWPFSMEPVVGPDGKNLKNEKGRLIKELTGKKKNYLYLYEKKGELKLKMVGLPVIKDNATPLGKQIVEETLKPIILKNKSAKFDKAMIQEITSQWLSKPNSMKGLASRWKVKSNSSYKPNKDGTPSNNIYAQISRGYFGGNAGVISLIKNKKIGRAGKTAKYCTYEEAVTAKLEMSDLDLTKLKNELGCFMRND